MTRLRTVLIALVAAACVATFVAGTVVAPSYPPLPVDPFWLVWVGFPVVGGLILVKASRKQGRVVPGGGIAPCAAPDASRGQGRTSGSLCRRDDFHMRRSPGAIGPSARPLAAPKPTLERRWP